MPRSEIQLSASAQRDLAEIVAYTRKEWSEQQAVLYFTRIKKKFSQLQKTPGMGIDKSNLELGLRSHPVGSHIIYYQDTKEYFRIVRILHQAMDAEQHFPAVDPHISD